MPRGRASASGLRRGHSNLGNVLRELGRLDDAKTHYAEALRLNPNIGMAYNNMAQALQEEGKLDEALSWYQQALLRDPNAARIHANVTSALEEQDRHEKPSPVMKLPSDGLIQLAGGPQRSRFRPP